eukprot:5635783-Lingulodinium_polyedra.AAC.1
MRLIARATAPISASSMSCGACDCKSINSVDDHAIGNALELSAFVVFVQICPARVPTCCMASP